MKKRIVLVLFLAATVSLFGASKYKKGSHSRGSYTEISPSKKTPLTNEKATELSISSNVSGADVYINGSYYGTTPITIKNLREGHYNVEVSKGGYESFRFSAKVREGYRYEYRASLKKVTGRIVLENIMRGASVYIDGSLRSGHFIDIEPGYHKVEIKLFGFEVFYEYIDVLPFVSVEVRPHFVPARFYIDNFEATRKVFNPDYSNVFGSTDFTFYVNANGSAKLEITDLDGNVVWTHIWNSFSTWNQSVKWNGTDNYGVKLEDGVYTATLTAEDYEMIETVTLDRSISYQLFSITKNGSGIGNMPMALNNDAPLYLPYFNIITNLNNRRSSPNYLDLQTGLLLGFANHCEFNSSISYIPYLQRRFAEDVQLNISFKVFDSVYIGAHSAFCYGGAIHWGFVSDRDNRTFFGFDRGCGLGGALMLGFDFPKVYVGFSSDYIFAAVDGVSISAGSIWKNGIGFSYKPVTWLNINTWAALNSNIKVKRSLFDANNWFKAVNFGGEVIFFMGDSSFLGNIKYDSNLVINEGYYYSIGFGLSYFL